MIEALAKNLWLLLTVVMPGLFTYGVWRLMLLLQPSGRINGDMLSQIDASVIATLSIIVAIALLQQAVAIAIEALLAAVAKLRKTQWPNFHALFCERFALAAAERLDENATRIVGNFFQSVNMSIGLLLLVIYFKAYEGLPFGHWVVCALAGFLVVTCITAVFRMVNAIWAIKECKRHVGHQGKGSA